MREKRAEKNPAVGHLDLIWFSFSSFRLSVTLLMLFLVQKALISQA